MNDKDNHISIATNESSTIAKNNNMPHTETRTYSRQTEDDILNFGVSEKINNNTNNKNISNQYNAIISYYFSTFKYLLNSGKNIYFFPYIKNSRNFVRKSRMNISNRNDFNANNDNVNYINNNDNYKNYINNYKYNFYNVNKSESNQFSNCLLLNENLDTKNTNKSQYYINDNNLSNNNKGNIINNLSNNNFCDLSIVNKIAKNIINEKDFLPFIPSNYIKKEKDNNNNQTLQKKTKDSTLALFKEEDINNESIKFNIEKKTILNNNIIKNDEILVERFGKKGWICILCNNFNYEIRTKCNRCGIMKRPKKLIEVKQKSKEDEGDWICIHCKNLNYSFRIICNRCKSPKIQSILQNKNMNSVNIPMA